MSKPLAGNLSLLFSTCVWATMFPVTEQLLHSWDPITITAGRLTGGAIVLTAMLALTGQLPATLRAAPWGKVILLGVVGVSVSTVVFAYGIRYSGAVSAALVATTSPIIAALLARFIYSEPLRKGIIVGVVLAVAGGVCVALADGERGDETSSGFLHEFGGGEILILIALSLWIWYSHNCQRWLKGIPQIGIAALTVAAAAVANLLYILCGELSGLMQTRLDTSPQSLTLIAYLALGPASFSLFLWHFGVSRVGITIASMYSNLAPIIVVLIAIWFGRYPTLLHLAGGGLIIAGVLYAQIRNLRA